MKNKSLTALALSAVLAVSFCGCDDQSSKSSDNSTGSKSFGTSEISDITPVIYPEPEDATFLIGAAGDFIGASEITKVLDIENNEISPDEMTEENFYRAFIDSAYYSVPLYPCLTNIESEYDEDALLFKNAPQGDQTTFFKVKKGDEIFGLTVAEASSEFSLDSSDNFNVVSSTSLALEGEVTLDGYACVIPGDEYGVAVGDIIFLPVGNVRLPVVRFDSCDENGVYRRTGDVYLRNGITYTNEFADKFALGNINDTAADVSILPSNGSFIKVSATISDIRMVTTSNWITQVSAEIVNISEYSL